MFVLPSVSGRQGPIARAPGTFRQSEDFFRTCHSVVAVQHPSYSVWLSTCERWSHGAFSNCLSGSLWPVRKQQESLWLGRRKSPALGLLHSLSSSSLPRPAAGLSPTSLTHPWRNSNSAVVSRGETASPSQSRSLGAEAMLSHLPPSYWLPPGQGPFLGLSRWQSSGWLIWLRAITCLWVRLWPCWAFLFCFIFYFLRIMTYWGMVTDQYLWKSQNYVLFVPPLQWNAQVNWFSTLVFLGLVESFVGSREENKKEIV